MPVPEPKAAQILDCTIRDGGYVVDFQFTKEDTFVVARGLAQAGITRIEVGHGLGLNASQTKGRAAESDEDYIRAAVEAASGAASIGSFFIPGIGSENNIKSAFQAGLGFIRLGIDVDEFQKLEPYVKLSKSLGLEVWCNLMKSYLVSPREFGEIGRRVGEFGVDVVALVDSAGGMTPDEVASYTAALRSNASVPIAFHGHDNLRLSVANSLRFVQEGGLFVDGSLAGIGRSGGNAATELLAVLLSRRAQLAKPIDWEMLIEFADSVMQFCVPGHKRPHAAEIAAGLNFFHSGFSDLVNGAVDRTGASLFRTLLRLPESSRKLVSPEVALLAAQDARKTQPSPPKSSANVSGRLERTQPGSLEELASRLRVDRGKFAQPRVVTLARGAGKIPLKIGPLRKNASSIVAHIELADPALFVQVRTVLSGLCELYLVDRRLGFTPTAADQNLVYFYDDEHVVALALSDAVQMLGLQEVAFLGGEPDSMKWIHAFVSSCGDLRSADALVACSSETAVGPEVVNQMRDSAIILLLRAGALSNEAFVAARQRGLTVWRIDCGAALVAEVERILSTKERFRDGAGSRALPNGKRIVAGGIVGDAGDVVVDHCLRPRFILGEADGCGGIQSLPGETATSVQQWIVNSWNL